LKTNLETGAAGNKDFAHVFKLLKANVDFLRLAFGGI